MAVLLCYQAGKTPLFEGGSSAFGPGSRPIAAGQAASFGEFVGGLPVSETLV
ncbi:hypothetical protein ACVILI_003550 [Mesorhizobium sp. USDA 4775]|jgi:hypothetical protein|uniref:hypothetical protein n=1 Tax=Mesorhizobium jarvisii TaxID=1777867 RepID=UPI00036A5683|nr:MULTISPECIES: hypothetical protein [Mesorhizobium]AID29674.1 hypothetical protein MCHK_1859 [Mesorhizobium huakuii 7653R]MCH4556768.1 hypothetical protein [Mesorhizobium jarvisii]